jgi:transcription elongation factor GreA
MTEKFLITKEGFVKLKAEIDHLKNIERPKIIKAIETARELGDLKENAEYHAAREQQGFCEARIRDIEAKLGGAEVIDPLKLPQEGRVVFGVTVVIENLDTEEQKRYKIVGDDEADFKANKISSSQQNHFVHGIVNALVGLTYPNVNKWLKGPDYVQGLIGRTSINND